MINEKLKINDLHMRIALNLSFCDNSDKLVIMLNQKAYNYPGKIIEVFHKGHIRYREYCPFELLYKLIRDFYLPIDLKFKKNKLTYVNDPIMPAIYKIEVNSPIRAMPYTCSLHNRNRLLYTSLSIWDIVKDIFPQFNIQIDLRQ